MSGQLHDLRVLPSCKQPPQLNGERLRREKQRGSDGKGEMEGNRKFRPL
jgi:hypothetical protein